MKNPTSLGGAAVAVASFVLGAALMYAYMLLPLRSERDYSARTAERYAELRAQYDRLREGAAHQ